MARLEVPCMVLDEYDLQHRTTLCEWRQDRHDLEAARVFGGAHMDMTKFPTAFQRPRYRPEFHTTSRIQSTSLIDRIKAVILRTPDISGELISKHHTSPATIDTQDVIGLGPNID